MRESNAQPENRNRGTRLTMLAHLSIEHGIEVGGLARAMNIASGTATQMLRALEVDRCVWQQGGKWYRTDKPLPAVPTSTAVILPRKRDMGAGPSFDFCALMEAWSLHGDLARCDLNINVARVHIAR